MTLLKDARTGLLNKLMTGKIGSCPCCDQTVKLYKRKITKVMARQLQYLDQHGPTDRGDLNSCTDGAHEWMPHKLHLWGLIALAKTMGDGKYHITDKGKQFVGGTITVPKFLFTYNSQIIAASEEQITFSGCLQETFNLPEMMMETDNEGA